MRAWVGTSGYSYKEWKGHFYPEKIKPAEMLAYYATRLKTVEINNTFYRMPRKEMLTAWAAQVPETFSFVLKASRRITHQQRLKGSEESLSYLLDAASVLEGRLGPILFQMPPYFKKDVVVLRDFLALLPEGRRGSFEFRNPTWFDDEVYEVLRAGRGALVVADGGKDEPARVATADFGYLRLRREDYDDTSLDAWAKWIREQPWEDVWVFFKHEDEGAGPRLAARLAAILEATG
ncbi:MAG: DUF72 domain-containing protein [Acidobacteriota bacterium]|nr:DUF72 domain-containing protein [Acidobacteriota bacterium]